jgi:hypothetical protein
MNVLNKGDIKMKNIFKRIKNAISNYFAYKSELDYKHYSVLIDYVSNELEDKEILNFTHKGFNYIFEDMILKTSYDLIIFVKNYECLFDANKVSWLKVLAEKFDRFGESTIRIYTYSGEISEEFKNLHLKYKSVYYTPLHFTDDIEANNFIVSDKISYWLEEYDSAKVRNSKIDNIKFKAKVNFKDTTKAKELVQYANKIDKNVRTKIKANPLALEEEN